MTGSKFTDVVLNIWILTVGGVSSKGSAFAAFAACLFYTVWYTQNEYTITRDIDAFMCPNKYAPPMTPCHTQITPTTPVPPT